MSRLWRIHLRPKGGENDVTIDEIVCTCIKQRVIGIGWQVDEKPGSKEEYIRLGERKYGDRTWRSNANAILYRMEVNDLIWFRDTNGIYFLGRIGGDWEYRDNEQNKRVDIVNVRPIELVVVGSRVPGKIMNSFIPARTVQQIHDRTALLFSQIIFNRFGGDLYYDYDAEAIEKRDIFSLLSSEDLEDVVGLYLQMERGYALIPSSRGRRDDTIQYEFQLMDKKGKAAYVQVKGGNIVMDPDQYKHPEGKFILFSPAGYKYEVRNDTLETLPRSTIEAFLTRNREILPLNIRAWIEFVEHPLSTPPLSPNLSLDRYLEQHCTRFI